MSRALVVCLVSALLAAAAPASAAAPAEPPGAGPATTEEPSFGRKGTWLLGGGTYFSMNSEQGEFENEARTEYNLGLSPDLAWFFADRLALRLAPGLEFTNDDEENRSTWVTLDVGATAYLPLSGDQVLFLAGLQAGAEFGEWRLSDGRSIDYSGPRLGGEVGLALPAGTGGLAEVVATIVRRSLDRTQFDRPIGYDITRVFLGLRYSVIL